jgi:hypothetical protein
MNRFETFILGAIVVLVAWAAVLLLDGPHVPTSTTVDTDAAIGKCIQAQRVLYQVDRAQAAEKCLADLDDHGPARFARTWQNYETVPGSW